MAAMDAMDAMDETYASDVQLTPSQPGSYEAYLGVPWARPSLHQRIIPNLQQAARNLIEERPITDSNANEAQPLSYEIPGALRKFTFPSIPEVDFEPDPQLRIDIIGQFMVHLSRRFPPYSKGRSLVHTAYREVHLMKTNCKHFLHKLVTLQGCFNLFADHVLWCRDMRDKAQAGEEVRTAAFFDVHAALDHAQAQYKEFDASAKQMEAMKIKIASQKRNFILYTLPLLYNLEASSRGVPLAPLPLPQDFDIDGWMRRIGHMSKSVNRDIEAKQSRA